MKDFKLKDSGNVVKKRANKKLTEEAIKRIKEKEEVSASDYLEVTAPGKKKNHVKEVEPQLEKAKIENQLGVPNSFYDLNIEEQAMLMYYLSTDFVHPVTRERTHMNVTQSYITAYLDETEIFKIWHVNELNDGQRVTGKVKNYKKFGELKIKAMSAFNKNPQIINAWNDLVSMTFGANPEDMLKNAIMNDALYSSDYRDRNQNRKMAIDMLQVGQKSDNVVNVFLEGGGKELAEMYKNVDEYVVTEDDLKVDDDA